MLRKIHTLLRGNVVMHGSFTEWYTWYKKDTQWIYFVAYDHKHSMAVNAVWYSNIEDAYQAILDEGLRYDEIRVSLTLGRVKQKFQTEPYSIVNLDVSLRRDGEVIPRSVNIVPLYPYVDMGDEERRRVKDRLGYKRKRITE